MSDVFNADLLLSGLRLALPILLAAVGGLVCERSGIVNIALEGQMLVGAFAGVAATYWTDSTAVGCVSAVLAGLLVGALHGWFAITLGADQIVAGTAWNLLALGGTSALIVTIWGAPGASARVPTLGTIELPGLPDLTILDWTAFLVVAAVWVVLYRTPLGLRVRACGEDPHVALAAGVAVERIRFASVMWSGALAGLGGAYLSLAQVGLFNRAMTQGRGFIALAAVIFAKWRPVPLLAVCLLFGIADATQFRLQATGSDIPPELLIALPYVVALAALAFFAAWSSAPAAAGKPFIREG
jgi:general nucleoside transport system permease protein